MIVFIITLQNLIAHKYTKRRCAMQVQKTGNKQEGKSYSDTQVA